MARIKFLQDSPTEIGACSQSVLLPFFSDTQLQGYNLIIDYGAGSGEDVTLNTVMYLNAEYDREEYKYHYIIDYNIPKNTTNKSKVYNLLLSLVFEDDSLEQSVKIIQRSNTRASYVENIYVVDKEGNALEKDLYNRFVVPNSYPEGTKLYVKYDCGYPAYPSLFINSNTSSSTGEDFIDQIWTEGIGTTVIVLNGVTKDTGVQSIQLDYDDNWGIGDALTYVYFVRDGIKPVTLYVDNNKFLDFTVEGGNISTVLHYDNIKISQLKITTDATWLNASFGKVGGDDVINISIQSNKGESSVSRNAVITISGANDEGTFASTTISIVQSSWEVPYIGDAAETIELYGNIVPVIRTDYKGNVSTSTSTFTLFNAINQSGEEIIDNFTVTIQDEPSDFLSFKPIEGTRNFKIQSKDKYKYNYQTIEKTDVIDIELYLADGSTIHQQIAIIIEASPEHIYSPVWKDVYYDSPKNYFRFKTLKTGDLLYNGIIYPDASNKIKVNTILSDYININKIPFEKDVNPNNAMIEAILEISDTPSFEYFEEAKIYHLYWNYSYDYNAANTIMNGYTPGYYCMHAGIDINTNFANPIEYYDPRQYIFISYGVPYYQENNVPTQVIGVSKEGITKTLISNTYDFIIGDIATMAVRPMGYEEIIFHKNENEGEDPEHDYTWHCGRAKCTKADYAVYYLNSSGLWCWMLFEGKQVESLKTTLNKYFHHADNSVSYNIHNAIYSNSIDEYYELTSNYIKDEQSKKLKDLYTSPLIYVHELNTDVIYNVYLDTKQYTIKTFNNQGKKYYTHNIKLVKSINKNIIV